MTATRATDRVRLALLLTLSIAAFAFGAGDAGAFDVCGNNVCVPPFETAANCPEDCGEGPPPPPFCGDGTCNGSETCDSCLSDCRGRCITRSLADALKKSQCTNDDDNDCLDNQREEDLALLFSPHYYYDEDESCAGAFYTDDPDPLHFGRQDFFQVRPRGNPAAWTTTGAVKDVTLTFFFLHPHDCRSGLGGHQGDGEHVVFHLRSVDLRTWTLTRAVFHHHGTKHTFSGEYLKLRATESFTVSPGVAADQNSHGSWPGRVGSSSDCAGSEDNSCLGTCDCFRGTMREARLAGFREFPITAGRNIGGPPPERFRPEAVGVFGNVAFTVLDVGHGEQLELWTPSTTGLQKFCGWECRSRTSNGDCSVQVHGEFECSTPLSEKVDDTSFTPPLASLTGSGPEPTVYDAGESALLGSGVHDLVNGLSHLATAILTEAQTRIGASDDPIGEIAPLVAGRPREEQLRTLEWVLVEAPDKLEAVVTPGLLPGAGLTPMEIEAKAAELVTGLTGLLREAGHGGDAK